MCPPLFAVRVCMPFASASRPYFAGGTDRLPCRPVLCVRSRCHPKTCSGDITQPDGSESVILEQTSKVSENARTKFRVPVQHEPPITLSPFFFGPLGGNIISPLYHFVRVCVTVPPSWDDLLMACRATQIPFPGAGRTRIERHRRSRSTACHLCNTSCSPPRLRWRRQRGCFAPGKFPRGTFGNWGNVMDDPIIFLVLRAYGDGCPPHRVQCQSGRCSNDTQRAAWH